MSLAALGACSCSCGDSSDDVQLAMVGKRSMFDRSTPSSSTTSFLSFCWFWANFSAFSTIQYSFSSLYLSSGFSERLRFLLLSDKFKTYQLLLIETIQIPSNRPTLFFLLKVNKSMELATQRLLWPLTLQITTGKGKSPSKMAI